MLKKIDINVARNLQLRVQQEFQKNISDGFVAVAFAHNADRNEYVFVRGASGVDPTG